MTIGTSILLIAVGATSQPIRHGECRLAGAIISRALQLPETEPNGSSPGSDEGGGESTLARGRGADVKKENASG